MSQAAKRPVLRCQPLFYSAGAAFIVMTARKKFLNANEFHEGLLELDRQMGINPWLVAFAPIRLMTSGGFLAVSYLKNRDSTGDIDFLLDPEYAGDKEIKNALRATVAAVANELQYNEEWLNEAMSIFVSLQGRRALFQRAEDQGISLFKGQHLEILAAPIEWALERKLRRIYAADRGRKQETDIDDAVALLRRIKERNEGPLDLEKVRQMNLNGFDVTPDYGTMRRVAKAYQDKFGEPIFKT